MKIKSRNLNELKRNQLPKIIKNKTTIYEIEIEDGGTMFSLRQPSDSGTVVDTLVIDTLNLSGEDLDEYTTALIKTYTTFMKDSDNLVYGVFKTMVYSNLHKRNVSKSIVFELGSWKNLYGTEEEPLPSTRLSVAKIGNRDDDIENLPDTNFDIIPEYREDKFLRYNGISVY
jgi:hypothetical protein